MFFDGFASVFGSVSNGVLYILADGVRRDFRAARWAVLGLGDLGNHRRTKGSWADSRFVAQGLSFGVGVLGFFSGLRMFGVAGFWSLEFWVRGLDCNALRRNVVPAFSCELRASGPMPNVALLRGLVGAMPEASKSHREALHRKPRAVGDTNC